MNKEIMELIQPYMDKSLNEGCYVKFWKWLYDKILFPEPDRRIYSLTDNYLLLIDNWEASYIQNSEDNMPDYDNPKILWHYDITAVLKCIIEKWAIDMDKNWYWLMFTYKATQCLWKFPNKPLHLYTKEEEINLLELLKKLWLK